MTDNHEPEKKMKFRIQMKDPDGVYDSIDEVAKEHAAKVVSSTELGSSLDVEKVREDLHTAIKSHTHAFIEHGEYLTVEFDTVENTAVVVKRGS